MAVFKCKMCGGNIEFNFGDTIGICDSCGMKQTLPKATDDAVNSLFNRANALRLKSEFDRAVELYNKIISIDETQAEAYWGLILCKYGIEYVAEPNSSRRVPTCHRTSFESITADEDYKSALRYGDALQKNLYESEAKVIDGIQKEILKIAAEEKPFDVFLCYKETDESGRRTQDSVTSNEIYHQLTQEGYKVFYAAITLEDKLGQAYEPYIFAALNSAKVMLVIGSKPEYFSSVWVKNEWSRFLKLMKNDRSKLLIPCYKDFDAYELPDDFAHLQAQDMSKIGFINDIVRGIKKVVDKDNDTLKAKESVVVNSSQPNVNIVALKKRGFMALEDEDWQKADVFFEEALNLDAEDAECYLGKLMAELKVTSAEKLKDCEQSFENMHNYQKSLRFADSSLKNVLNDSVLCIKERRIQNEKRIEQEEKEKRDNQQKSEIFKKAAILASDDSYRSMDEAIDMLKSISSWGNSNKLIESIELKKSLKQRYDEYLRAYPVLEETELNYTKEQLDKMLAKTKVFKNDFPASYFIPIVVSVLLIFLGFRDLGSSESAISLVAGIVSLLLFIFLYFKKIYLKRASLISMIDEYDLKIKSLSDVPDFLDYAPEFSEHKDAVDIFLSEKNNAKSRCSNTDEAAEEADSARKAEIERQNKLLDDKYNQEIQQLNNQIEQICKSYQEEKKALLAERTESLEIFAGLNILQVSKKNEIKLNIEKIDSRIKKSDEELDGIIIKIKDLITEKTRQYKKEKEAVADNVNNQYPLPAENQKNGLNKVYSDVRKNQKEQFMKIIKDKDYRSYMNRSMIDIYKKS